MSNLSKPELLEGGKLTQRIGSRRQVKVYKTAKMTPGGLTAKDLVINKHGRIVSKKKYDKGDKILLNLTKKGWYTTKGKFGSKKLKGKALKRRKKQERRTRKNNSKKAKHVKPMKGGESSLGSSEFEPEELKPQETNTQEAEE